MMRRFPKLTEGGGYELLCTCGNLCELQLLTPLGTRMIKITFHTYFACNSGGTLQFILILLYCYHNTHHNAYLNLYDGPIYNVHA